MNPHLFCVVHKSYVINLRYAESFQKDRVHMINGDDIPVSRSMKNNLDHAIVEKDEVWRVNNIERIFEAVCNILSVYVSFKVTDVFWKEKKTATDGKYCLCDRMAY